MAVKFNDYKKEVKKQMEHAIGKALNEIGMFVEGEAKEIVPVDTGNLRNSITYEAEEKNVIVGSATSYAPFVELPTSKTKAQPFLRPAILDNKSTIQQIVEDNMKK